MRLRDVMSADVITAGPDEPASAARTRMRDHRIRHLVVVQGAELLGIVSERDLRAEGRAGSQRDRPIRELMASDVVSATPETTLRQAANLMRGRSIGCLLVIDNDRVVGIVTTTDLLDQLGRGATRQTVRTERPPVRRPPGSGQIRGKKAPRAAKQVRGRNFGVTPPAHVRVMGAAVDNEDRDEIARRLGRRLGKFASSIERISVRLSDVNGPRGGVDHRCLIKVVLSGLPSVVVERTDSALRQAINAAIAGTAQAVRRAVQRRRLRPLRGREHVAGG